MFQSGMENKPKLSVLILNYKTRGLLRQFLRGWQGYAPNVSHEIIVVDNNSNDGSVEMMQEQFPNVKLIVNSSNAGYTVGNNIGIQACQGEYVLLINTDVVITGVKPVEYLVEYLENNPKVAAVGPQLKNPDGTLQQSAFKFIQALTPLYRRTFLSKTKFANEQSLLSNWQTGVDQPVDWLMSSCIMLRRAALDEVGGLDERFFLYVSEEDLCRRLWLKGWQVWYLGSVSLIHYHRKQSASDWRVAVIHIQDFLKHWWKWRGQKIPNR